MSKKSDELNEVDRFPPFFDCSSRISLKITRQIVEQRPLRPSSCLYFDLSLEARAALESWEETWFLYGGYSVDPCLGGILGVSWVGAGAQDAAASTICAHSPPVQSTSEIEDLPHRMGFRCSHPLLSLENLIDDLKQNLYV